MTTAASNVYFSSSKSTSNYHQSLLPPASTTSEFNPIEKKYWLKKYALGITSGSSTNSKAKQTSIATISNSIIEGISFGCKVTESKVAIATGPRVCIKDVKSMEKVDRYLPFVGPVYCVEFRTGDGRVLAIGGDNGLVRVVDITTRACLRTFKSGNHTIRVVRWLRDGKRLAASGDDGRIYIWDLTQDIGMDQPKPTKVFIGHGDSVRDLLVWKSSKDKYCIISASYDHTIRIWDLDSGGEHNGPDHRVLYGHTAPVEGLCLVPLKNTTYLASVSNVSLYLHDIVTGELVRTCPNTHHAKTISCLMYYHDEEENISRIITGGIDGFIRIHDPDTLTTLHGATSPSPISTLSFSVSKRLLLIGTSTGSILFHSSKTSSSTLAKRQLEPMKGTHSYFFRTNNQPVLTSQDHIIQPPKKKQHIVDLQKYDTYLRKFQYADALDIALEEPNPNQISILLQELAKRHGVMQALSNRDSSTVVPIVKFLTKHVTNPDHSNIFIQTALIILEVYEDHIGNTSDFDLYLSKLKHNVEKEICVIKELKQELVYLDCCTNFLDVH